MTLCPDCGEPYVNLSGRQPRCLDCGDKRHKKQMRDYYHTYVKPYVTKGSTRGRKVRYRE